MAPTPRQNIEWTAPLSFDYASYYNYFLFYSTIGFCFATLQPVILLVTALFFCLESVLKKYLLMYVYITKTESGGQAWRWLYNRLVFAAILSNVIIGLVVKARGTWLMIGVIGPSPFLLLGFKWYCMKTFDDDIKYYVRTGMHDQESLATPGMKKRVDRIASRFGHPALYKPLMTPMVHAKAQHVLGEVYRGRLNSDGAGSLAFSDIAMEPIGPNGKAKEPDAPFEIVPEAQQDFAYYKNRPDFREEGGELYGRPEDLISERSQTPKSFMGPGGGTWSQVSSRATSPSPERHGISRKAVADGLVHPAFRDHHEAEDSDLGLRHGVQTDPYADDRVNLLGNAGEMGGGGRPGEFMGMDRWRTDRTGPGGTGYGPVGQEEESGSYDFLRGRR